MAERMKNLGEREEEENASARNLEAGRRDGNRDEPPKEQCSCRDRFGEKQNTSTSSK